MPSSVLMVLAVGNFFLLLLFEFKYKISRILVLHILWTVCDKTLVI